MQGLAVGFICGLCAFAVLFMVLQVGYANAVLYVARKLYGHGLNVQWRHAKAAAREREAWVKEYEAAGERA